MGRRPNGKLAPFLWVSDPFGEFSVISQAVPSFATACASLPRRYDRLPDDCVYGLPLVQHDEAREIVRITDEVASIVAKSQVKDGMVLVSAMHITAGVYVNDWESGLIDDIQEWVEQLAPARPDYRHHQTGEDNADAHLKRTLRRPPGDPADHARRARSRSVGAGLLCGVRRAATQARHRQGDGAVKSGPDPFDLVREWFAAYNRGELDAIDVFYEATASLEQDNGLVQGRDGIRGVLAQPFRTVGSGLRRRHQAPCPHDRPDRERIDPCRVDRA